MAERVVLDGEGLTLAAAAPTMVEDRVLGLDIDAARAALFA